MLIDALPNLLAPLEVSRVGDSTRRPDRPGGDARIAVRSPGGRTYELRVLARERISPSQLPLSWAVGWARTAPRGVVVSRFLSPRVQALCREAGLGYADLAGNCFLQLDDYYLERTGARNPSPRRGRPATLFSPVSSRVIRVLLDAPERAWRVIELARAARASLGQVSNVCRRLQEEAYAQRTVEGVRVVQPGALLDAWRDAPRSRPTQVVARYSFEQDPDRLLARVAACAEASGWRYAVTGLSGAARRAPFIRGLTAVSWYIAGSAAVADWTRALDLRPVEAGANAFLLVPYDDGVWYGAAPHEGVVMPGRAQLYLDAWDAGGPGREQADFFRQQALGW